MEKLHCNERLKRQIHQVGRETKTLDRKHKILRIFHSQSLHVYWYCVLHHQWNVKVDVNVDIFDTSEIQIGCVLTSNFDTSEIQIGCVLTSTLSLLGAQHRHAFWSRSRSA